MSFQRQYFPDQPDAPASLIAETTRRVRFEEVDLLGIVWHGRYPSYLEDGRNAAGVKFGCTYQDFTDNKVMAPLVQMHLDYLAPLRFDETIRIETTIHWSDALRLNYSYRIFGPEEKLVTRGYTVQLLTDFSGELLLTPPDWLQEFKDKWQQGLLG